MNPRVQHFLELLVKHGPTPKTVYLHGLGVQNKEFRRYCAFKKWAWYGVHDRNNPIKRKMWHITNKGRLALNDVYLAEWDAKD